MRAGPAVQELRSSPDDLDAGPCAPSAGCFAGGCYRSVNAAVPWRIRPSMTSARPSLPWPVSGGCMGVSTDGRSGRFTDTTKYEVPLPWITFPHLRTSKRALGHFPPFKRILMRQSDVTSAFKMRNVFAAVGAFAACVLAAALGHVLMGEGKDVRLASGSLAISILLAVTWLVGWRRHGAAESLVALAAVEALLVWAISGFDYGGVPRLDSFFVAWFLPVSVAMALPDWRGSGWVRGFCGGVHRLEAAETASATMTQLRGTVRSIFLPIVARLSPGRGEPTAMLPTLTCPHAGGTDSQRCSQGATTAFARSASALRSLSAAAHCGTPWRRARKAGSL